jgi:hypothetical protein
VTAVGYHHPRGAGNIVNGRRGEPDEVTQPGHFGRGGVLAERDDMIFGAHDQQHRRRDLVIQQGRGVGGQQVEAVCSDSGAVLVIGAPPGK